MFNLKKTTANLLDNIKGQMHDDAQSFARGFEQKIEKHGPDVHIESRELRPEEIDTNFDDIFDDKKARPCAQRVGKVVL